MKRGFTLIEICIVMASLGMLATIVFGELRKERIEMPSAYSAWVKQTGNPKELTYDEWRTLMRANERQRDTTLIFMPMNMGGRCKGRTVHALVGRKERHGNDGH